MNNWKKLKHFVQIVETQILKKGSWKLKFPLVYKPIKTSCMETTLSNYECDNQKPHIKNFCMLIMIRGVGFRGSSTILLKFRPISYEFLEKI